MKGVVVFSIFVAGSLLVSCTGYAPHAIDEKPKIKTDENLFGIWKVVEDTNKLDYILLQSIDDVEYTIEEIRRDHGSILSYEQEIARSIGFDYGIDTAQFIEEALKRKSQNDLIREYEYYLTRFDNNGQNPHYQQFNGFISIVGNERFLNIGYWHDTSERNERESGYFFARLLKVTRDTILATVVSDRSMRTMASSEAVRAKIQKNVYDRAFYRDTVHLYKVEGGHFGLNESMKLAN